MLLWEALQPGVVPRSWGHSQRLSEGEASPVMNHGYTLVNTETHLLAQPIGSAQFQLGAPEFLVRLRALGH